MKTNAYEQNVYKIVTILSAIPSQDVKFHQNLPRIYIFLIYLMQFANIPIYWRMKKVYIGTYRYDLCGHRICRYIGILV